MTNKTLTEVLERVETWPEQQQEQVAQVLLDMEEQQSSRPLISAEQAAEVRRRIATPHRVLLPFADVRKYFANRGHENNDR